MEKPIHQNTSVELSKDLTPAELLVQWVNAYITRFPEITDATKFADYANKYIQLADQANGLDSVPGMILAIQHIHAKAGEMGMPTIFES